MLQPMFVNGFIHVRWIDIIDIVLVAILIQQLYYLLRGTVAINIFVGILLFYLLWLVVQMLKMPLFGAILGKFIDVGFIALLIVFQQELRRFLLFIGTNDFLSRARLRKKIFDFKSGVSTEKKMDINAVIKACENMSDNRTGALIILTVNNDLKFYVNTGDVIDASLSTRMLESIFYKNSPLHDGAVIISDNRIVGARCVLPVTERENFPAHLGMRHRAAAGITESTDALAIVVSEQTGGISFAKEGNVKNNISSEELRLILERQYK